MYKQGAVLGFVYHRKKKKKKIENLVSKFNPIFILQCDVNFDKELQLLFENISKFWKNFDGIVHSIAYAPYNQLRGKFIDVINREDFLKVHEVSSYSFTGIIQQAKKFLNPCASLLTLSYIGSIQYVPYYNIMGLAKASLESSVRYLAYSFKNTRIRVNAISPGPIKTLSSFNINRFTGLIKKNKIISPFHENITINEVGNVASFLCSNFSKGINGQIIYVDNGCNISNII